MVAADVIEGQNYIRLGSPADDRPIWPYLKCAVGTGQARPRPFLAWDDLEMT
jgi:hypothetical protein